MPSVAAISLLKLSHALPPNSSLSFQPGTRDIARKRNEAVRAMLDEPAMQWLCMIDSDQVPPADTIRRLLASGRDIIGAMIFERREPFRPAWLPIDAVGVLNGDPEERVRVSYQMGAGAVEAAWVGTGCMMIRRHVLEAMPDPWFEYKEGHPGRGEDTTFCHKARAAGFRVWVDTSLDVGHVTGGIVINEAFVRQFGPADAAVAHAP